MLCFALHRVRLSSNTGTNTVHGSIPRMKKVRFSKRGSIESKRASNPLRWGWKQEISHGWTHFPVRMPFFPYGCAIIFRFPVRPSRGRFVDCVLHNGTFWNFPSFPVVGSLRRMSNSCTPHPRVGLLLSVSASIPGGWFVQGRVLARYVSRL